MNASAAVLIASLAVLSSASIPIRAETFYVAGDATPAGDGSRDKPFQSVEAALAKVGGGHTVVVKPGVYRGPLHIDIKFAGRKEAPTTIRSEVKWKATLIGSPGHVISNDDDCHWVTVDGFEVLGARYDGIKMNGDHNVVRNCWVHNNQGMGVAMHNRRHGVIENNLVEFNGSHIQFAHGVYADGEDLVIRGNVVRHNSSYGLHLYPSIRNSRIENNLVYGQVRRRGIILACPVSGGGNRIVNNTVVEDEPLAVRNGAGEVIANNILIGGDQDPISLNRLTRDVFVDFNLCVPKSGHQRSHAVTGEARFVDAEKGLFWLRPDSMARGKGSPLHAPEADFWGRPYRKQKPIDLGAMPFVAELTGAAARARFVNGWPYHRGEQLPDLWALTVQE